MAEVIVHEVNLFINRQGTKNNHIYYSIAYLNRVASMVAPKDEKVRTMLFRIYFSMFQKIIKSEPQQPVKFKKDRTKSKDKQKKSKPNDDLEQQDNKIAELVLKGVNTLMVKCSNFTSNAELKKLIEEETNVLFKLTHHEVFRI